MGPTINRTIPEDTITSANSRYPRIGAVLILDHSIHEKPDPRP